MLPTTVSTSSGYARPSKALWALTGQRVFDAHDICEICCSGSSRYITCYMPELSDRSMGRLVSPSAHGPRKASGSAEGRQARPERFEAMICASAQAIDLPLGGRGRLAGSIGAYPGHICRESP